MCRKYQPAFVDINLNIKKNGALKIVDGDLKWNSLKSVLQKLSDAEVLQKIQSDLNSSSLEDIFNMIIYINKLLSVFNQISCPFEIYNSVGEIIVTMNNLIGFQILEKIFLVYSMADSPANLYVIYPPLHTVSGKSSRLEPIRCLNTISGEGSVSGIL